MKFRNAVVVGSLVALASGCANLSIPKGHPSRTAQSTPEELFVSDSASEVPVAAPKVASAPEKPGLRIRKSKRGNMESYVVRGQRYFTMDSAEGYSARGIASWYGPNFHGRTASNGEVYDMYRLTAAHKTLPLPTYARVTHIDNGRSVVVKINDRGPFSGDRIIDLSFAAALRLGMVNDGTGMVEIQALTAEEMMAMSGPENKLDIDFYYSDANGAESNIAVAESEPVVPEDEVISVAAVDVDQKPITPQPITTDITTDNLLTDAATTGAPAVETALPVAGELLPLDEMVQSGDSANPDSANPLVTPAASGVAVPVAVNDPVVVYDQDNADQLDGELKDALMPIVADANVQSLATVGGAVQSVPLPSDKDRTGYYIQAGVYADVTDAERIAVDVVLAAPGEEVHVKPLKDSHMYRITVGPIISSEHATKVSGLLTEAGLDNFTVNVK